MFFSDDSLLITRTIEEAKANLKLIKEASEIFGLKINEKKSKIMIYKSKKRKREEEEVEREEIEGIEVVKKLKYLGLEICDDRDIFKEQKEEMIERATKLALQTYSVIDRSCNKVLMGKLFWKSIVLPSILLGAGLMDFTKDQIERLQRVENSVYRKILGARGDTTIVTMLGEIGASRMESRIIQERLMITKCMMETPIELIREVLRSIRENKFNKWNIRLKEYMEEAKISDEDLSEMSKAEIKEKVKERDTERWREEIEKKPRASLYKEYKGEIKEEKIYDNTYASELLFGARANSLNLNDLKKHKGGKTVCDVCGEEEEDLVHFIVRCRGLEDRRDKDLIAKFKGDDDRSTAGKILFETRDNDVERVKRMLRNLWSSRKIKGAVDKGVG